MTLLLPANTKVHLAFGLTDMRKGIDGLAMLIQEMLRQDPFNGHLFLFRGRKANLVKILFWDGSGLCLFTKRLEQGVFLWLPEVERGRTLPLTLCTARCSNRWYRLARTGTAMAAGRSGITLRPTDS